MSAAVRLHRISVEDYLAGELNSRVKHEYLGGFVYAMAGATNAHNLIASNTAGELHNRLRSTSCRAYNSDTKIRIKLPTHFDFYYPDASVICESNPPKDSFQDRPVLIVEVLSRKTRRIDQGEKKDAYLTIPTLHLYLLIEQDFPGVTVYRRTEQGFVQETYADLQEAIPLPELNAELPLADIYEEVKFVPETEEGES
jgi:Uma2 family endonuclease